MIVMMILTVDFINGDKNLYEKDRVRSGENLGLRQFVYQLPLR